MQQALASEYSAICLPADSEGRITYSARAHAIKGVPAEVTKWGQTRRDRFVGFQSEAVIVEPGEGDFVAKAASTSAI